METLAVPGSENAKGCFTQLRCLLQYRIEHWRNTPRRGIDDLQHFGGRSLLLQGFARLRQQPRVLHCNDRLDRKVLQQRDLLVGERPDLLAIKTDAAE